jgi:GntR family transcriptional regulator
MLSLELDRSGAVPIYVQLREWLEERIVSGEWPPGTKLKAEAELADELELARGTVRKAIEELCAAGMLMRTHGRGTFVSPRPVEQPLAQRLVTHSESLLAQGIRFTTHVHECGVTRATALMASHLRVPPGEPLLRLHRVRSVDGEPIILLHNSVVLRYCLGIESRDFTTLRLFQVLEEQYALRLMNGRRTFQAQVADEAVAAALQCARGDAVMYMEQTTFLPEGSAIEFSNIWLKGSHFRLSADVERGKQPPYGLNWLTDADPAAAAVDSDPQPLS